MIRCLPRAQPSGAPFITTIHFASPPSITISASHSSASSVSASRRTVSLSIIAVASSIISSGYFSSPARAEFSEIPNSGGVKSLDLRVGDGEIPIEGDQVAIHYYGRLAAKQGWRFDSTYDHKDSSGDSIPFTFILGSTNVIPGIETAVRSMKVGGIRRVVIPPSQGYLNTSQEPLPPNFFDRQRLFTTIFNPTRLANGEGSTLGTLVFDIELVSTRRPSR
ncbi:unnamed protein product [Eruca vesicaria subsp. sativa]|uniref:peptidylprolyl isomerase n=1 Tax=Eruca vesicaria subsp. sativa TaxID=29727 RepID=A0ABC8K1V1_ERUVS|nr:unnamed protein product [Eruca vesicaria subsp. sativa]